MSLTGADNPYRPGFSQPPELLAGRDDLLAAADDAVSVAVGGRTPRPLIFVGARGVGKTVMLAEIAGRVGAAHGWPRLRAEARPSASFIDQLVARADGLAAVIDETPARGRLRSTEATVRAGLGALGAEVRFERPADPAPGEDPLRLEAAFARLAEVAAVRSAGVVVTVDEAQLIRRGELAELAAVLQAGTEEGWPFVVAFAGLVTMRNPDRSVTYIERGEWHEIGMLDETATLRALVVPAVNAGRPLDMAAAQFLAARTGGYPYAVQLYGHHAWAASRGAERIDLPTARIAAGRAATELEDGLYATRWTQASPRERQYLAAVAALTTDEQAPTGGDVARHLNARTTDLSSYRDRLLTKGTLVADGGQLRFAVPGMADYVRRQTTPAPDDTATPGRRARLPRRRDPGIGR